MFRGIPKYALGRWRLIITYKKGELVYLCAGRPGTLPPGDRSPAAGSSYGTPDSLS